MDTLKKSYPGFDLIHIRAENPGEIPEIMGAVVRVEMPAAADNDVQMRSRGYIFGDRTLGVTINLKRIDAELEKMIRFEVRKARNEDRESVLQIALSSFPSDRRFHVRPEPDRKTAEWIIREWVSGLSNVYVCIYKDTVVGFLDLEPLNERDGFIHLAAVTERYRAAGAAISLYASVIKEAGEAGKARILGRISSMNTAVMNLYARLGGTFSDPLDVFLKDE